MSDSKTKHSRKGTEYAGAIAALRPESRRSGRTFIDSPGSEAMNSLRHSVMPGRSRADEFADEYPELYWLAYEMFLKDIFAANGEYRSLAGGTAANEVLRQL